THVGSRVTPSDPTVLGRKLGSISFDSSVPTGKRARVKKYACGRASGHVHAATAFLVASAVCCRATRVCKTEDKALRRGVGQNQAARISLSILRVLPKLESPPNNSSPPSPVSATFSPASCAAQETKYVLIPSMVG